MWVKKGVPRKPVGKRSNRPKPVVPVGVLTHRLRILSMLICCEDCDLRVFKVHSYKVPSLIVGSSVALLFLMKHFFNRDPNYPKLDPCWVGVTE